MRLAGVPMQKLLTDEEVKKMIALYHEVKASTDDPDDFQRRVQDEIVTPAWERIWPVLEKHGMGFVDDEMCAHVMAKEMVNTINEVTGAGQLRH